MSVGKKAVNKLLRMNVMWYMNGQSAIPHKTLFDEGYFDFVDGKVVPTARALEFERTPWSDKITIDKVRLDPNPGSMAVDVLRVTVRYKNETSEIPFGSYGITQSTSYNTGNYSAYYLDIEDEIVCNYDNYAALVLKWIKERKYHQNIKNSVGAKKYVKYNDNNRFTWMKWLIKEIGMHDYEFTDGPMFVAGKKSEQEAVDDYTKAMQSKDYALLIPPAAIYKHFPMCENMKEIAKEVNGYSRAGNRTILNTYDALNPGVHNWLPLELYGRDENSIDKKLYENLNAPFYYMIENNMFTIKNGVYEFNALTKQFLESWENHFRKFITDNIPNWRQSLYKFDYKSEWFSTTPDDDTSAKFAIEYLIPGTPLSQIFVGHEESVNRYHSEMSSKFHIVELAQILGVYDKLSEGLACVTHPTQLMQLLTLSLHLKQTNVDKLSKIKGNVRDCIAGVIDYIERHMKV